MSNLCDTKITNIKENIDKLHLEKSTLDQELRNLFITRKSLEENVDRARLNRNEAIEGYNNSQDALKLAKFKTEKIEVQTKSLEDKSNSLREKIGKLQENLESELKREENDLCSFEEQMKHLSYLFLNAIGFYTSDNLEEENSKVEKETEELERKLSEVVGRVETLNAELEGAGRSQSPADSELPPEQRRVVLKMFREEHRALQLTLDRILSLRNSLRHELGRLQS